METTTTILANDWKQHKEASGYTFYTCWPEGKSVRSIEPRVGSSWTLYIAGKATKRSSSVKALMAYADTEQS